MIPRGSLGLAVILFGVSLSSAFLAVRLAVELEYQSSVDPIPTQEAMQKLSNSKYSQSSPGLNAKRHGLVTRLKTAYVETCHPERLASESSHLRRICARARVIVHQPTAGTEGSSNEE